MCWDCFKLYTDKPVINAWVQRAYDLIIATDYAVSDLLHVIVADMNVDNYWLSGADEDIGRAYAEAPPEEQDVFNALAKLTEPERATAVAMAWGYIERDGTLRSDLR